MENVKQIWQETAKQLEKVYDKREAENISYLLFEDLFHVKRGDILLGDTKQIDISRLEQCIVRLLNHEPLQYVTGIADFYGYRFHLAPGALIPRPETEELVELIMQENTMNQPTILDVGVGSGCIAITLALKTGGEVFGIDISEEALAIATQNARQLDAEVNFTRLDVLHESFPFRNLDILVSNPPYIPEKDKAEMSPNVLAHEPEEALFVSNEDPLIFYKRIAEEGQNALKPGGKLYFEIHERYGQEVSDLLEKIGYAAIEVHQDMQGKDRMVSAVIG